MSIRERLAKVCRRVYDKEFVSAYDGNVSARVDDNRILITPSGKSKGEVEPEDFLMIDLEGNLIEGEGKFSTEAKIHLLAYKHRPEINGVVHAHPIFATTIATTDIDVNQPLFAEVLLILGKIAKCDYGTPSTDEVPESLMPYIDYAFAFLLGNHGAMTISSSIEDAYYKMEKLESYSKLLFNFELLGQKKLISENKLLELYSIAESTYGIKLDERNKLL
jgi:L-fuculose-phosphate aldolase